MKLCHAAALALVGWYLMVPPHYKQGTDTSAPRSEWEQHGAFDTAEACERAKAILVNCGEILNGAKQGNVLNACGFPGKARPLKDEQQDTMVGQIAAQDMESECIATDDPRLKSN